MGASVTPKPLSRMESKLRRRDKCTLLHSIKNVISAHVKSINGNSSRRNASAAAGFNALMDLYVLVTNVQQRLPLTILGKLEYDNLRNSDAMLVVEPRAIRLFEHQRNLVAFVINNERLVIGSKTQGISGLPKTNSIARETEHCKATMKFTNITRTVLLPKRAYGIVDGVGSGKTYSMISICLTDATRNTNNFIVVPHSLVYQWKCSLDVFPGCTYFMICRTTDTVEFNNNYDEIKQRNIILVSSTMLKKLKIRETPNRMFFDEFDILSSIACKPGVIHGEFNYFVSATLFKFLKTAGSYWGMFHGFFITDKNMINRSISIPEYIEHTYILEIPILNTLMQIPNQIKYSLKNDMEDQSNREIVKLVLTRYLKKALQLKALEDKLRIEEEAEEAVKASEALTAAAIVTAAQPVKQTAGRLAKIRRDIAENEENMQYVKNKLLDSQCCICYNNAKNYMVTLCCTASLCYDCFVKLKDECAQCRAQDFKRKCVNMCDLTPKKNKRLKLMEVLAQIGTNTNRRVLIFCLEHEHVEYLSSHPNVRFLRGSAAAYKSIVESFVDNTDNVNATKILVARARRNCAGFNLQQVTDLIVMNKLPAHVENQIIGRAQRYGRTGRLNYHTIVYDAELKNDLEYDSEYPGQDKGNGGNTKYGYSAATAEGVASTSTGCQDAEDDDDDDDYEDACQDVHLKYRYLNYYFDDVPLSLQMREAPLTF